MAGNAFCSVVYGFGSNLKYKETMSVEDVFRRLKDHFYCGYAFVNVYFKQRLVYTTQGVAGSRYVCDSCPYYTTKGEKKKWRSS